MQDRADPSVAPFAVVVDDNPVILLHAADILTDAGFSVFTAAGSDGALEWLGTHGDAIVLLLTNVEIPGPMDGFELARHVAELWPGTAILVSSGRFEPQDNDMPKDAVFIPKPFSGDDVLRSARTVLALKNPRLLDTLPLTL